MKNDVNENKKLKKTSVSKSFYCNQDDGEYNNNPCSKQCSFCKQAEFLQKNINTKNK